LKKQKPAKNKTSSAVPNIEIEAIARCFLPFIRDYFESEEGQREFAEWQRTQAEKKEQTR
jgi:hypothetical protein